MGVQEQIEKANAAKRKLFQHALSVGKRHNIDYLSKGKRPPLGLHLEYEMLNKTVFSLVRKELGLENAHFFPTAGATVNPKVDSAIPLPWAVWVSPSRALRSRSAMRVKSC